MNKISSLEEIWLDSERLAQYFDKKFETEKMKKVTEGDPVINKYLAQALPDEVLEAERELQIKQGTASKLSRASKRSRTSS